MRRLHLRGRQNISKRLLVHVAGFNLGLLLRRVLGVGTPRGLLGARFSFLLAHLAHLVTSISALLPIWWSGIRDFLRSSADNSLLTMQSQEPRFA
jgi:transposase